MQIEQLKAEAKKAESELAMKMGLLKLMGDAELNQAKIKKLEAEAEAIKVGVATEGEKMRLNQINSEIALSRERREGILGSIETMNKVYSSMMDRQPQQQGQPQQPPLAEAMGGMMGGQDQGMM